MSTERALLNTTLVVLLLTADVEASHVRVEDSSCRGQLVLKESCPNYCSYRLDLVGREDFDVPIDNRCAWRATLESTNCWSRAITVPAGDAGDIRIKTRPAAMLKGSLQTDSHSWPERMSADLRTLEGETLQDAPASCVVDGQQWRCIVPAGSMDIRISPEGYAPRYFLGLTLSVGEKRDVGSIALSRGASIAGSVSIADKHADVADVVVTLEPLNQQRRSAATSKLQSFTTKTNGRGFFQFVTVPPGTYDVIARKRGWSSAVIRSVNVSEGQEIEVPNLRLETLATLEIIVSPAQFSNTSAWQITIDTLRPGSGLITRIVDGAVPRDGTFRKDGLERGSYEVSLLGPSGSVRAREVVDVQGERTVHYLLVHVIPIHGKITLGADPLKAKLTFSWKDGSRIQFESNEVGEFEGSLPHEGKWLVSILPENYSGEIRRRPVEIRRRAQEEYARADVSLAGGKIHGIVVNADQQPVSANISVYRGGRTVDANAVANTSGVFEIVGLEPGPVMVGAENADGESGLLPYVISTDKGDPLRLTVLPRRQVEGRIVTMSSEPLAGALVRYSAPTMFETREAISGPNGVFRITLPRETTRVTLVILEPGFATKLFSIELAESVTRFDVSLSDFKATLVVALAGVPPWPFIAPADGAFIGLRFLLPVSPDGNRFGNITKDGFEFQIEPGTYTVCPDPQLSTQCVRRTLLPGERITTDARDFWSAQQRAAIRDRMP